MNTGSEGNYASVLWKYLTKPFWNLDDIKKGFNIWISHYGLLLVHSFLDKFWIMEDTFYKKSEIIN